MDVLPYLLSSAIVSAGIAAGAIIGRMAIEEVRKGEKNLARLMYIFLILAGMFLAAGGSFYAAGIVLVSLAVSASHSSFSSRPDWNLMLSICAVLGITFFYGYGQSYFIVAVSMIFLYGLPAGSLLIAEKNGIMKVSAASLAFFAVASAALVAGII